MEFFLSFIIVLCSDSVAESVAVCSYIHYMYMCMVYITGCVLQVWQHFDDGSCMQWIYAYLVAEV